MSDNSADAVYDAAEAIDELLSESDGQILAAMAFYKSSLLELFGREGLVEILRQAVDSAPNVEYFSRRSRREIDPGRPEVNLRVNDAGALAAHESLAAEMRVAGIPDAAKLNSLQTDEEHAKLVSFKSNVIFTEVCVPMATRMNEALAPHWERARSRLIDLGLSPERARLMMCSMFSIRVGQDSKTLSKDKMAVLTLFI